MLKDSRGTAPSQASNPRARNTRDWLTYILAIGSLAGILSISVVHIVTSPLNERKAASERVFNTTMPLFGTWMGSLIAYYFAKENLDAAADNNRQLTSSLLSGGTDKLESTLISAVINNRFLCEYVSIASMNEGNQSTTTPEESSPVIEDASQSDDGGEAGAIKEREIRKVLERMERYGRTRLPIFAIENTNSELTGDKLRLLTYYDDLNKYDKENPGRMLSRFTEESLALNKMFIFVGQDISLAEADRERHKKPGCRDIFVTNNGFQSGRVIGYLTDLDIDQYRSSA